MSDYDRSTTAMTLATLPEPIRTAIRDKAEALQLTVGDDAQAYLTPAASSRRAGCWPHDAHGGPRPRAPDRRS